MRRPETLADQLRAKAESPKTVGNVAPPEGRLWMARKLKELLTRSRRYVLDSEATFAASKLGVAHPELLQAMLRRARAPYGLIWVEFPLRPALEATNSLLPDSDTENPERVGFFIEQIWPDRPVYRLQPVGITQDTGEAVFSPLCILYSLDDDAAELVPAAEVQEICRATHSSRLTLRMNLLGAGFVGASPIGDLGGQDGSTDETLRKHREEVCAQVSRHACYAFSPYDREGTRKLLNDHRLEVAGVMQRRLYTDLQQHSGDWRLALSILALLNARDYVRIDQPGGSGGGRLVRGRVVPYLSHNTVRIDLPRTVAVRKLIRSIGHGLPKRRHEVAGYYANSHKHGDPTCVRLPIVGCERAVYAAETPNLEVCLICGHRRWWVQDHERGDASLGYVTKDYAVEKRR
jgi:hypothetical protein